MDIEQDALSEIKTRFRRSKFCRTIHADGAWGSITPHGTVHVALFSEHLGLPDSTTVTIGKNGVVTDTPDPDAKVVVREIEVEVILSEGAALGLRDWLTQRLTELQAARVASVKEKAQLE
jgi:hypothetical protein